MNTYLRKIKSLLLAGLNLDDFASLECEHALGPDGTFLWLIQNNTLKIKKNGPFQTDGSAIELNIINS